MVHRKEARNDPGSGDLHSQMSPKLARNSEGKQTSRQAQSQRLVESDAAPLDNSDAEFPETGSMLDRMSQEQLARLYAPACYAYFRTTGLNSEHAMDHLLGFWADKVLGHELFKRPESGGRLRDRIKASLRHYKIDQWRHTKRIQTLPITADEQAVEDRRLGQRASGASPESVFNDRVDMSIAEQALVEGERHFSKPRTSGHWPLYFARVVGPAVYDLEQPSLGAVYRQFGFESEARAGAAVQTVARYLRTIITRLESEV